MTSVAGLSGLSSMFSFDPSQMASRLISGGDQNGDSALSFSEFSALGNTTSSGSANASISSERMTNLFNTIDTDSDGSLTERELTEFGQKLSDAMESFMLQMQEQGMSAGGSQGGTSSQSSSYDALDTNKDGVVSMTERLAGSQSNQNTGDLASRFKSMTAQNNYQAVNSFASSASAALSLRV